MKRRTLLLLIPFRGALAAIGVTPVRTLATSGAVTGEAVLASIAADDDDERFCRKLDGSLVQSTRV